MTPFENFILEHEKDDCSRLLLCREKWPDIDMDLAVSTIESRRRLRNKLPEWYAHSALVYPSRLCSEQCSSGETAAYKAEAAGTRIFQGRPFKAADLTGGLGADAWAFSRVSGNPVLYNEMNTALARAAGYNFSELGTDAIIRNMEIRPGNVRDILGDFQPDLIFMDPARRSADGRKVFLLEECSPDVTALQDELFACCRHIMLKLSPMADLSMLRSRLSHIREIHVVATGGECREVLVWQDRDFDGDGILVCCESGNTAEFPFDSESGARGMFCKGPEDICGWLFEPGKSLTKAGLFKSISLRFDLPAASPNSHLYISLEPLPEEVRRMGKVFEILSTLPLNGRNIKNLKKEYPRAEVSARPMSSDELRKRLGVDPSAEFHIFGLRAGNSNLLVVCRTC